MDFDNIPAWSPDLSDLEKSARLEKWAQKALDGEYEAVASAGSGKRNIQLNESALKLGHKVASGGLQEAEVVDALLQAARQNGFVAEHGEDAARATISSGLEKGKQEPQYPPERPGYQRPHAVIVPQPERQSRFYSAADLDGKAVPERQWLVHGFVPKKTVTLFSGDGGTGKSLLALMMAVRAATGKAWLNKPVPEGRALFLSAEDDDDELHMRLDAIRRGMRLNWSDLSGLTLRSLAGEDALLAAETKIALMQTALFDEIEARAKDEQPSLIVLDTLADMFPANENDRAAVRQFIGILRGLALRQKCAVVLLSHPSLTGLSSGTGTSGSTAWNNSVRSRLYLERIVQDGYEADPDKRMLSTKKANYGRIGDEVSMTWTDGMFICDAVPQGLDALSAAAKAERVFLTLLQTFTEQGRRVNHAGGPNFAPKLFAEHPGNEGLTKRVLKAAMEGLLAAGKIKIEAEGPPSRRVTYIARRAE